MNNKGSFKDENTFGKKVKGFFKESGFYIAIVVGLCALAAGAVYFSTNQILTDPDPQQQAQDNGADDEGPLGFVDPKDLIEDQPDQSSIVDNGAPYADEGPVGLNDGEQASGTDDPTVADAGNKPGSVQSSNNDETTAANDGEAAQSASGNEAAIGDNEATADVVLAVVRPAFQSPLSGGIQAEYSMDKLVFSPTFNEWRTHSGVDISAPRGEVVRAIGNGKISEIKNDPRYGFTIVIDHNNGYKSLYANLASDQTLQVGQEVKLGDPIGAVGATAIFESAEPTHLHFELYKENKLVDPVAYMDLGKATGESPKE